MEAEKLGTKFKRALLVEDNDDICDFYRDFFEGEDLSIDVVKKIPGNKLNISDTYDILICDWLVGPQNAREWIFNLHRLNKLPAVTVIATGMMGLEEQIGGIPASIVYKPFDFEDLKSLIFTIEKNQKHPI